MYHPLSKAACNIPSAEEQLAKHRDGQFEWVLLVGFPMQSTGNPHSINAPSVARTGLQKVYFGCNLFPSPKQPPQDSSMKGAAAGTYVLLVTPIDEDEEPLQMELRPSEQDVVPPEACKEKSTPKKILVASHEDELIQFTPSTVNSNGEHGSPVSIATSMSPSRRFSRIEDSVEALDELEDQLEEFDQAAHFHRVSSKGNRKSTARRPPNDALGASINHDVKATTPQPKRSTMLKTGSATARDKSTTEIKRTPSIRKSASMTFLDPGSCEARGKEKPLVQSPSFKQKAVTRPASLNPPKPPVKSTKPPTIPSSFELPGDATARRLKEKREARAAMQAAAEQASKSAAQASSLRRTKSARTPTRPTFELPGEAISRRKREEHEAQLRAQDEEERKRREFKARPIRSSATPNSYPRETVASRARQQNKTGTAENTVSKSASLSPSKSAFHTSARAPLSSTMSASQPRGRGLHAESDAPRLARAASHASSTGSGKRSMLSAEDLEQQRLRGQTIYKRDNSFSEERAREKKQREMLAKLAREEAAERSRQRSREWAAKQAQKRMTISSLRDIAT
ncbi:hypothetical protein SLS62_004395 [Diatrype stigma]|uniref:Carboxylesterase family protein n=1 Tax=Diatrype stigma TaxID=117547 RepID=A0AAN9UUJ9_9PEZI